MRWALVAVALVGLMAGLRFRAPDPAEAVTRAARLYVAETGGAPTDCTGTATDRGIRVTCAGEELRIYDVTRWGIGLATLDGVEA